MHHDSQSAVLANDLDSMVHRIEALPAHPRNTDALNLVTEAKRAITEARIEVHQREMKARFAALDAA